MGLEQTALTASKTPIPEKTGTDSGTHGDDSNPSGPVEQDPDLAYLIDRWPGLRQAVKSQILGVIRSVPDSTGSGGPL